MKGTVRRTAVNLVMVLVLPVVCLLGLVCWASINSNIWYAIAILWQGPPTALRIVPPLMVGAAFGLLQLRSNHPWCCGAMARWCLLAGWDGKSTMRHLSVRLSVSEVVAVAVLVLLESLVADQFASMTFTGWAAMRIIGLSIAGAMSHRGMYVVWAVSVLALMVIHVPVVAALFLSLAVWLFEWIHRQALAAWAQSATLQDPQQWTRNLLVATTADAGRLDPRYAQVDQLQDNRPGLFDAVCLSGLVAWTSAAVANLVDHFHRAAGSFSLDNLPLVSILVVVGMVANVVLLLRRTDWYALFRWWPSPGFRSRLVQRRWIVTAFDCGWLSFAVALLPVPMGLLLSPGRLVMSTAVATTTFLILRVGPDPVRWQLTAPARMVRKTESIHG